MRPYRYLYLIIIVIFIAFSSSSCSTEDDGFGQFSLEGTNVSIADIAGNWEATRAHFSRSAEGPILEVDVVEIGGSLSLKIENNGRFSVTIQVPESPPEIYTGRFAFDEDLLVINFDEDPDEWEYFSISHQEPNLLISGGTVYEALDIDGDGTREDVYIDFELVRAN